MPVSSGTSPRAPYLAIYGPLAKAESQTLLAAGSALDLQVRFFESPASLAADLEETLPVAVVVVVDCDGAFEVMTQLRGKARYAATPLFGVAPDRTDLAFGAFYDLGGDDLITARSLSALSNRFQPLARVAGATQPARSSGSAVVATSDLRWRNLIVRTLSNVGIEPCIVGNGPDAAKAACGSALFVLATDDLPPDGAVTALTRARTQSSNTPWVIAAPTKRGIALRESLRGDPRVSVVDKFMPPDNLLFTANELRRPPFTDQRAAPRVLFGTTVLFRVAGGGEDDVGFTYNVSSGGVFVRTLAPLDAGQEVWLELWPPRTDRAVRLVGRVSWRRAFGPQDAATVPPGFGVHIADGLSDDLSVWEAGCRALVADRSALSMHKDIKDVWERLSTAPPVWFPKPEL